MEPTRNPRVTTQHTDAAPWTAPSLPEEEPSNSMRPDIPPACEGRSFVSLSDDLPPDELPPPYSPPYNLNKESHL